MLRDVCRGRVRKKNSEQNLFKIQNEIASYLQEKKCVLRKRVGNYNKM